MSAIVQIITILCLVLLFSGLRGQQKLDGIVMDKGTKQRVARVFILNKTSGANVFNNSKGEFSMDVNHGDVLIAKRDEYANDTLFYQGQKVLLFNLKRTSIYIEPVTVVAKRSPEEILARRRYDYDKAFKLADPGDYLSVGPTGAGLSINAIYNSLSREGRNARKLTRYFQREYEDNVVDATFSKALVSRVTGLQGEALEIFISLYKPSYSFVLTANAYQLTTYIKSKYEMFKIFPPSYYKSLPELDIETDAK